MDVAIVIVIFYSFHNIFAIFSVIVIIIIVIVIVIVIVFTLSSDCGHRAGTGILLYTGCTPGHFLHSINWNIYVQARILASDKQE